MSKWLFSGAVAPTAMMMAALSAPAQAAVTAQSPQVAFAIPAGPLDAGLRALAAQSGERVLYDADLVRGRTAPAVSGAMTTDAAATRLLAGSGLVAQRTSRNVLVVQRPREMADLEVDRVDDVVVTGSLIRGVADGPSPVDVLSRDLIDRQGHASVAQALAALPQNFAGTANEAALPSGADLSGTNASFASGLNLRGLGSDATLVLINGRRMAGSGAKGDFADISTIPTSAVSRIEVLLDGASALYGSDAVGGVVNIILRTDFEGAETRARVGNVTDGPTGEYGFGQTLGKRWSSGGALISYEYLDREALPVSERERAGDADLRRFGGSDRRMNYANPGNIVAFDPVVGGYVPQFAIPSGQDGTNLTPSDFLPGQVNLDNYLEGMNVLGRQTRHSLFIAADQQLGERLTLTADARVGRRTWDTRSGAASTILSVNTNNPFFVSPTGATSHQIAYAFREDIGSTRLFGETENLGASFGGTLRLAGDWNASGYIGYAREEIDNRSSNQINSVFLNEALGLSADNPATGYSAPRDGYFNPFGDGANSSAAVREFIGSGRSRSEFRTTVTSANLQLDGTLLALPGGDAKLAFGLNARRETQGQGGEVFTYSVAPIQRTSTRAQREVAAAFLEVRAPLFGPDNRRAGLDRLELSLAARYEDYDDIGSTTNPKVGILWAPVANWVARASYGTSFRAPALTELNESARNSPTILPEGTGQTITLIQYGGNAGLAPEEAESWTAGLEYRSVDRPGLRLGLGWFRTDYDSRIGRPAFDNIFNALDDATLDPFIRRIAPATNAADRTYIQDLLNAPNTFDGDLFPVDGFGAVLDARYVNTSRLLVEGVDLTATYDLRRGEDAFTLGGVLTHMYRYESQATPTSLVVDRLDTPNNPLSLRARGTLDWSRGSWGAGLALNHVGNYRDLNGRRIDSWTTADLQLRLSPETGPLSGLEMALTVQNLFDTDPPFYDSPQGVAYDAVNANVLGRFVAFQVTRKW